MPAVDVFAGIGLLVALLGVAICAFAIRRLRRLNRAGGERTATRRPPPPPPPA